MTPALQTKNFEFSLDLAPLKQTLEGINSSELAGRDTLKFLKPPNPLSILHWTYFQSWDHPHPITTTVIDDFEFQLTLPKGDHSVTHPPTHPACLPSSPTGIFTKCEFILAVKTVKQRLHTNSCPLKILPRHQNFYMMVQVAFSCIPKRARQHTQREWADELQISPDTNESFEDLDTTNLALSLCHTTLRS